MKFIELHDEIDTFWVNINCIEMIVAEKISPKISACIYMHDNWHYCNETPEEILQKIAEATQSERSFMNEWEKEVEDPLSRLGRLKAKKDGATDAIDRW